MNEHITLYKIQDLTDAEYDAVTEKLVEINILSGKLSSMTKEQRIDWLRRNQYPHSINFEKEIGGTVYTANAHFSNSADKTLRRKVEHIIMKSNE